MLQEWLIPAKAGSYCQAHTI